MILRGEPAEKENKDVLSAGRGEGDVGSGGGLIHKLGSRRGHGAGGAAL